VGQASTSEVGVLREAGGTVLVGGVGAGGRAGGCQQVRQLLHTSTTGSSGHPL
jgi:hypothetical protein